MAGLLVGSADLRDAAEQGLLAASLAVSAFGVAGLHKPSVA
jgi:hypothetical protein